MIVATTPAQPSSPRQPPRSTGGGRGSEAGLLARLVDRALSDPDGGLRMADALDEHRRQRSAAHGGLLGALVVRLSTIDELLRIGIDSQTEVVLVADTGMDRLPGAVAALRAADVTLGVVIRPGDDRLDGPAGGARGSR